MENLLHARKITGMVLVTATIVLALIIVRLSLDQWQAYSLGMESMEKNDYKGAVMYFDRVLNAHIPFSPLEEKAKKQLLDLAGQYEKEKEYELALLCYETIRTGRYLTRHFVIPDAGSIPFLNGKIASIKSKLLVRDGIASDADTAYKQQMEIMNKDFSPSVFWSVCAVLSLCAYIGSIVLWIVKKKRRYVIVCGLSLVAWLTSLYLA